MRWVIHSDASYGAGLAVCWATVRLRGFELMPTPQSTLMRNPRHLVTITRSTGGSDAAEILAAASGLALARRLEIEREGNLAGSRAVVVTDSIGAIRALQERKKNTEGLRHVLARRLIAGLAWKWPTIDFKPADEKEVSQQDRWAGALRRRLSRDWRIEDVNAFLAERSELRGTEVWTVELPEVQRWFDRVDSAWDADAVLSSDQDLLIHHALSRDGRVLLEVAAPAGVPQSEIRDYACRDCALQYTGYSAEVVREWFRAAEVDSYPIGVVARASPRMQALYRRYASTQHRVAATGPLPPLTLHDGGAVSV